jgi:hypothetical protein
MAISLIFLLLGTFYGHLVYNVVIWYIFTRFDMLFQKKSGNPAWEPKKSQYDFRNYFLVLSFFLSLGLKETSGRS